MKIFKLFLVFAIFFFYECTNINSPKEKLEKVFWEDSKIYFADEFSFNTNLIEYICDSCNILEIKCKSGITGYYVSGNASFSIQNTKGKSNNVMFRFNPSDRDSFIKIKNIKEIKNEGFRSHSMIVLQSIFKRCYHSKMDAFIPNINDYAADIFTEKDGELLISNNKKNGILYYNYTTNQNLSDY